MRKKETKPDLTIKDVAGTMAKEGFEFSFSLRVPGTHDAQVIRPLANTAGIMVEERKLNDGSPYIALTDLSNGQKMAMGVEAAEVLSRVLKQWVAARKRLTDNLTLAT